MCDTPKITEVSKPDKSRRPKAKLLSDGERRKMVRHITATGQQNEFNFPPQSSPPKLEPINKKRRKR